MLFIKNTFAWYGRQPYAVKAPFAVLCCYIFIVLMFFTLRMLISFKSEGLMVPYKESNKIISENIQKVTFPPLANTYSLKLIKDQERIISQRSAHHYQVALVFFKNYYAVTVCLMIISCIGGLLLFMLINKGWAGSNYTLKVLFLAMASLAIFLGLFKDVFSQEKNYKDNMLRYMQYTKAELVMAQQVTGLSNLQPNWIKTIYPQTSTDSVWVIDTAAFWQKIDTALAVNTKVINELTDYIFTIDAAKMQSMNQAYNSMLNFQNVKARPDTTHP